MYTRRVKSSGAPGAHSPQIRLFRGVAIKVQDGSYPGVVQVYSLKPGYSVLLSVYKMATGGKHEQLTNRQIVRLAAAISTDNMTSIAEGYMDIDNETVKNIRRNEGDSEAFNRAILRYWANKHPDNQVQVGGLHFNV